MSYHLRVKICGITSEGDGVHAALSGADAVGLNFAPESPRCIDSACASRIIRALPPFVEAVGVWVQLSFREINAALADVPGMHTIQWHGRAPELTNAWPRRRIVAWAVRDRNSLSEIDDYLARCREANCLPTALLVDGHAPGMFGGTGVPAPWQMLAEYRPNLPLILAGGLTPDNVAEAVRIVRPYGVDVASGVESAPGRKDPEKVRRFVEEARNAALRWG